MIITIAIHCRKCWRVENREFTVADWSKVRKSLDNALKFANNWSCQYCDCKAAYWYIYRNPMKEDIPVEDKESAWIGGQQVCYCTADEGFPVPEDLVGVVYNPITRTVI